MNKIKTELITPDQIASEFIDDYGIVQSEVEDSLIIKWTKDVLEEVNTPENLVECIDLLPINNYKVTLDDKIEILCEVAYREEMKKDDCKPIGYRISQWKKQTCEEGCELEINLVCPACHKTECSCHTQGVSIDIDYLWADAHPEIYYKHYSNYVGVSRFGYGVSSHDESFRLMTPANDPWYKIKHLPNCANIHCKQPSARYSIENSTTMDTSIKDGWVLISYLGRKRSEDGELQIDISNRDILKAIVNYVAYKFFNREYIKTRESSSKQISSEAFQLYEEYLSRYLSANIIPPAQELMNHFASTKFVQICRAMENYMNAECPYPNMPTHNPYKTKIR